MSGRIKGLHAQVARRAWVCDANGMRFHSFLLIAASVCACRAETDRVLKTSDPEAKILATIDGVPITTTDLQTMLDRYQQQPFVLRRFSSPEKMNELLDSLVRHEVLALEARKRGYDRDPEVLRIMKERMVNRFTKQEITDKIKPADISQQDVLAYYQAHTNDFYRPLEVRISQILVSDKAKAQKILTEAHALPRRDSNGFRDLVMQYTEDDDSKARGGDLMFFARKSGRVPPAVEDAAFAMKEVGELAGPVETPKGFVIFRLTDRKAAALRTMEESRVEIQTRLAEKYRSQRLKELVEKAKHDIHVEIYKDVLAQLSNNPPSQKTTRPFPLPLPTPDASSDSRRIE